MTLNKDQDNRVEKIKTIFWIIAGSITNVGGSYIFNLREVPVQNTIVGFALMCVGGVIVWWCGEEFYRNFIKK